MFVSVARGVLSCAIHSRTVQVFYFYLFFRLRHFRERASAAPSEVVVFLSPEEAEFSCSVKLSNGV